MQLEEAWHIFNTSCSDVKPPRSDLLSILTETDHPILFRPFFMIHPCRTAEILAQTEKSCNRIITFLSVMGPYVQLKLKNEYGMLEPSEHNWIITND